jgi:dGTPase
VVSAAELPEVVRVVLGTTRREQLAVLIRALISCIRDTGTVGMATEFAQALAALRAFNYERIYNRPASIVQGESVVRLLTALVERFTADPALLPGESTDASDPVPDPVQAAVAYVAGMTDRFAFDTAVHLLGWPVDDLPEGIDSPVIRSRLGM